VFKFEIGDANGGPRNKQLVHAARVKLRWPLHQVLVKDERVASRVDATPAGVRCMAAAGWCTRHAQFRQLVVA